VKRLWRALVRRLVLWQERAYLGRAFYTWYRAHGLSRWDAWRIACGWPGTETACLILGREARRHRRYVYAEVAMAGLLTACVYAVAWVNQGQWTGFAAVTFCSLAASWASQTVRACEALRGWRHWRRNQLDGDRGMRRVREEDQRLQEAVALTEGDLPPGADRERVVDVGGRESLKDFEARVERLLAEGPTGNGQGFPSA
jgi:hypothetical protein